jgi:hypothetical protein
MGEPAPSYKPEGWSNVTMMTTFDGKCAEALELYKVRGRCVLLDRLVDASVPRTPSKHGVVDAPWLDDHTIS